ncbi:uncharacterized protein LOC142538049 [Primulina tabacum]|uniref:uncharacterized protein LOC142538049 n=1 Tax=Primulina tabacum TaxID=48773 RepID=UPI003F59E8E3
MASSGIDRIMVVVIRYFGGIKLGTGGLVRAYGGVASECLRNSPTCVVTCKLQIFQVEEIKQDYDIGKDNITIVNFKVDFYRVQSLEEAIKSSYSRDIVFYKN